MKASEEGTVKKGLLLNAVFDSVKEAMPTQKNAEVEKLVDRVMAQKDVKVNLGVFLKEGVGVCRHDALACAFLLDQFKADGYISGKVSVDRNYVKGGSHAWCRYTNSVGEVYILDVAQNYFGTLKDATGLNRWIYSRPDDY